MFIHPSARSRCSQHDRRVSLNGQLMKRKELRANILNWRSLLGAKTPCTLCSARRKWLSRTWFRRRRFSHTDRHSRGAKTSSSDVPALEQACTMVAHVWHYRRRLDAP